MQNDTQTVLSLFFIQQACASGNNVTSRGILTSVSTVSAQSPTYDLFARIFNFTTCISYKYIFFNTVDIDVFITSNLSARLLMRVLPTVFFLFFVSYINIFSYFYSDNILFRGYCVR